MKNIQRPTGISFVIPDDWSVQKPSSPPRRGARLPPRAVGGVVPMPAATGTAPAEEDALVAALRGQEMAVVDTVVLTAPRAPSRQRAAAGAKMRMTVDLAAEEDAAVLLVQDGVYSWSFPQLPEATRKGRARRAPGAAGGPRRVVFELAIAQPAAAKRGARRGLLSDFVFGAIKAVVLRFTARVVAQGAMRFLERKVRNGLVVMRGLDPLAWPLVEDAKALDLPEGRAARILLFVHGTFSSTIGGYGGLTATEWGRGFLLAAAKNYDAVIGFDHPTLSETPLDNAVDLIERLAARTWALPPAFDVICHSRGGLVFRSLVEHIGPMHSQWQGRFERAVFVAATNGGTLLAEPENWHALADLYTNLAVGATRLAAASGVATLPAATMAGLVQGIGAFVKYLATEVVTDGVIPGLAAMEPDGEFVKRLNEFQPGQPTPGKSRYYAITSDFKPAEALKIAVSGQSAGGLPEQLLLALGSGFMRKLMREANDVVVNTDAMTAIDRSTGAFIKDQFDFGANGTVYHTIYFHQPQVVNALARWLQLVAPENLSATPGALRSPDAVLPGGFALPEVPAAADIDLLVTRATQPAAEVRTLIAAKQPSYLVVQRDHQGGLLHYAFPAEEMMHELPETNVSLTDALGLHEYDASPARQVGAKLPSLGAGGRATARRVILMHGEKPVGVIPETSIMAEPLFAPGTLAVEMEGAGLGEVAAVRGIQHRRAMPSFTRAKPPMTFAAPSMGADTPGEPAESMAPVADEEPKETGDLPAKIASDSSAAPRSTRGPRRSTPVGAAPLPPPTPALPKDTATSTRPENVPCHFHAEMPAEVQLGKVADVRVTVSREQLQFAVTAVSGGGKGRVTTEKKITIQVLAKANARNEGDDRVDIDVPAAGAPVELHFDIVPTYEGDGVIHVIARQGPLPIVIIELRPQFVTRKADPTRTADASATVAAPEPFDGPVDHLRIDERKNGSQVFYQFDFISEGRRINQRFESRPLQGSSAEYVAARYLQIEQRWISTKGDLKAFQQELRAIGGELWSELVPPELQQLLWSNRKTLRSVMIFANEPFIPWEIVHFKEPGKPQLPKETIFLGQCGAVRWLIGPPMPPKELRVRPGRAFTLVPRYPHPDYELPETPGEEKEVTALFGAKPTPAEQNAVRDLLAGPGAFDLLHFAGHGSADAKNIAEAQILLTGRVEGKDYVMETLNSTTARNFADLQGADGCQPIVAFNACQAGRTGYNLTGMGGFAPALLDAGAGLFIGTLWSVGDGPARAFAIAFYKSLKAGKTVAEAVSAAREPSQAVDSTWLAYVVYGHPHARLV